MVSDRVYRLLLSSGITFGGVGLAWILMKAIVPSKEEMLKRLPEEATSPEALAAEQRRNEQFIMVLQENMRSNNPAWKVMGIDEVKEKQKKRKELQQNKESKLRDKKSNEFST
ncbi:hypothetical protein ACROYT_G040452 [Oculina patagonica]